MPQNSNTDDNPDEERRIQVALYYDAADRFKVFRREEPYPFRRIYAIGQSFVEDSRHWNVIAAWIGEGRVYHVICAPSMPYSLAEMLRASSTQSSNPTPP